MEGREFDLVRRPDVDQEDVVLAVLHQFPQSRLELGAAPPR
jgi:hypothetical protein